MMGRWNTAIGADVDHGPEIQPLVTLGIMPPAAYHTGHAHSALPDSQLAYVLSGQSPASPSFRRD
jgi:hypothetical protein